MSPANRLGRYLRWFGTFLAVLLAGAAVCFIVIYAPAVAVVAGLYVLSSAAYSLWLKRIALVEILLFIWFYLARVMVGGAVAGVHLSSWLTLSVIFLALFLVVAKRYSERRSGRPRAVLNQYPERFLEGMLFISAALVMVCYGLYSILGTESAWTVYSTLPVLAGVMRYLQLVFERDDIEHPEKLIFRDNGLLLCSLAWFACVIAVFYL